MPENRIISEGKTTNEAIEKGLKMLKVSKDMVNVRVIENEDKRSFFSILAPRVVKVELTLKENIEKKEENHELNNTKKERKLASPEKINEAEVKIKMFLDQFLKQIGEQITYSIEKDEYGLIISINGKESGIIIGYRGETLYAIQNIISAVVNKNNTDKIRVLLDIEGYKAKREKTLQDLARKIAHTVEKNGKSVTLEPMQAYERKIIHATLQNHNRVTTVSIGEEPRRKVVISLKK